MKCLRSKKQCNSQKRRILLKQWLLRLKHTGLKNIGPLLQSLKWNQDWRLSWIFSFKWKCPPGGTLIKHRERMCAHWGMKRWGARFWEIYAPVVDWINMQIILVIEIIYQIDSRSIDNILVFTLSNIDQTVPIYMISPNWTQHNSRLHPQIKQKSLWTEERIIKLVWVDQ